MMERNDESTNILTAYSYFWKRKKNSLPLVCWKEHVRKLEKLRPPLVGPNPNPRFPTAAVERSLCLAATAACCALSRRGAVSAPQSTWRIAIHLLSSTLSVSSAGRLLLIFFLFFQLSSCLFTQRYLFFAFTIHLIRRLLYSLLVLSFFLIWWSLVCCLRGSFSISF